MKLRTRIFLTALATAIGGLCLQLYVTLSKDVLFSGIQFCTSSTTDLVLGTMAMFASAVFSGFIASLIVVRDNFWPHFFITLFIIGKLSVVALCGQWGGPLWFEAGLHFSLLAGLWLGWYGAVKFPLAPV
ncbi:hypothetical protein J0X14_12210 [Muricauda sp. CAU 1633]|uniref:hypothetical protein n=1 Tax=Allomuricauda sp. CAU 1633 TaxID=2816036 RepID=UPI001A8D46B2|nr:hypothetical protein [Muricauda sp. CAU 1633]MBO0323062.1 hypothetical protein [Muricauda sp. CAU 1633]